MAHESEKRKKDRECRHAIALLRCIGEDPARWEIKEPREKPDLILISPGGEEIGLELTELIAADCGKHGKHRAAEHAVCTVIRDETQRFIGSHGVAGARISGHNRASTPVQRAELDELRGAFRRHLEIHGSALLDTRGCMRDRFEHNLVVVRWIARSNRSGVRFDSDMSGQSPPYAGPAVETIEGEIIDRIRKKCEEARKWERSDRAMWLAMRNPGDEPIETLPPQCVEEARQINAGRFTRIVLFNDPEHVADPCPALPRCVEIV
ncbi:MAG: hypothetical protein KJZ69_19450 [Phycisphaerales bacterium]|nr:hypothetical protein [Phycisphaerales bacterium]